MKNYTEVLVLIEEDYFSGIVLETKKTIVLVQYTDDYEDSYMEWFMKNEVSKI